MSATEILFLSNEGIKLAKAFAGTKWSGKRDKRSIQAPSWSGLFDRLGEAEKVRPGPSGWMGHVHPRGKERTDVTGEI